MKSYKVAFIGYGKQGKKIENNIKKNLGVSDVIIYHPKKKPILKNKNYCTINNFNNIIKSDIIIISSPNKTHAYYLNKLHKLGFNNYIFCEKPLCENKKDFKELKKFLKKFDKLYVNFNYRHSAISNIIKKINNPKYGKPIQINFYNSHGLAFKNEFNSSWRSTNDKNFMLFNKAIHIIDLLIFFFDQPKINNYESISFAKNKSFNDTLRLSITFKNKLLANIFCSYSTTFLFRFEIICTNSHIIYDKNKILIYYPRNSFGKNKQFITPPVNFSKTFSKSFENDSLINSTNYFCNIVKKNGKFKIKEVESYLKTHKFLLDILN